ncbi:hypothetical protein R5R35_012883 [Gryllus longicercus]
MATQDTASLKAAITQYKSQLSQVNLAINSATGPEHENLILLRSEIQELINLTQETLDNVIRQQESLSRDSDDPLAKEYALFKAELENDSQIETNVQKLESIEDDLKSLNGMKCQAPHKHQWGETCYHNALVCGAEPTSDISTMEEIQVRVMFINPTHREMLPCPYFLDGECRFSDEKCHYSHGELVCLSALKEYRDPDFSIVQPGKGILAKSSDNLWYRAIVLSSPENNKCAVKFESSGKKCEVNLHDTIPLEDKDQTESAGSGLSDESDQEVVDVSVEEFLVQQSLLRSPPNLALGGWEKYTKGFGSRLMAQMGYITGTGLGKNGEGRIEPVEAVILPAGKSLDHCMELKEQAGGDEDLFKAEKRLKRLQKKEEQKQKQLAEREKNNKNIFDFINSKLGGKKGDISDLHAGGTDSRCKRQVSTKDLQSRSNKNLNLVSLQVDQEIKRAEQEIARMQESLVRHAEGTSSYKRISGQLQDKHDALKQLRLSENNINQESKRRKDHKKLTIF